MQTARHDSPGQDCNAAGNYRALFFHPFPPRATLFLVLPTISTALSRAIYANANAVLDPESRWLLAISNDGRCVGDAFNKVGVCWREIDGMKKWR